MCVRGFYSIEHHEQSLRPVDIPNLGDSNNCVKRVTFAALLLTREGGQGSLKGIWTGKSNMEINQGIVLQKQPVHSDRRNNSRLFYSKPLFHSLHALPEIALPEIALHEIALPEIANA